MAPKLLNSLSGKIPSGENPPANPADGELWVDPLAEAAAGTLVKGSGVPVGLVVKGVVGVHDEFLRCDGALLVKADYPDLFAAIGTIFNGTTSYIGQPWRQQYLFNMQANATLSGWATGTALSVASRFAQVVFIKDRVYLLGGMDTTSTVATVYSAPVNTDGTLGAWVSGSPLPGPLRGSQAVIVGDRIYLLGGHNGSAIVATVYSALINVDGTLGTWTTGINLPVDLTYSQAIVTSSRVYLLGGSTTATGPASLVYSAPIDSAGVPGAWVAGTDLPSSVEHASVAITKDRVYLIGGQSGSPLNTTYTAPINSDGTLGAWTTGTALPAGGAQGQAVVINSRVYFFVGNTNTVYTAPIDSAGVIGTWASAASIPGVIGQFQVFITSSRMYMLGGYAGGATVPTVYVALFSGGLNNYFPVMGVPVPETQFKVPDTSISDLASTLNLVSYIKAT